MRFRRLEAEWDEDNVEHIGRHGIEPEEVEEIVYEDCYPSWIAHVRRHEAESLAGRCSDKPVSAGTCLP